MCCKMDIKFVERRDDCIELEFDSKDKDVANSLLEILIKQGVDAYFYELHLMIPTYRLHIEANNAEKELKTAINMLEKEWSEFGKLLRKEIKQKSKK